MFAIMTLLGAGASIVIDVVKLFVCQPVVMTVRRCVHMPIACFATMELSDRHCVAWGTVPATRARVLNDTDATFEPTTVTLMAPEAAALDMLTLLGAGASIVIDAVKLFTCHPVVSTTRRSGHTPTADRTAIALSDVQWVTSVNEPPERDRLE